MLKADRNAIRCNFVLLVKEVPCLEILPHLHQDGILSAKSLEEVLEQPESERNCFLLLLIQRRGPIAFSSLVNSLKKVKRIDLVRALTSLEDKLSELSL